MFRTHISHTLPRLTLIASLGLAVALPATASADTPHSEGANGHDCAAHGTFGRHHRGQRHGMRRILKKLNLTASQKANVRAILSDAREQRREIKQRGRSEQTHQALRALKRETREQIREVLTPAQRQQAKELRVAQHAKHADRKLARMTERLSLTPAQARQIKGIFEQAHEQKRALRAGNAAGANREDSMRTLRKETRAKVRAVLTAEQREQLRSLRERRGHKRHQSKRGKRGKRGNSQSGVKNGRARRA